jgi:hypothetical protein
MVNSIVNSLLFKPPQSFPYDFPLRILRLTTARGETIAAAHVKRRGAHVTMLFSHGNAEDLNSSYHWMKRLSKDLNVNVLGYDYSGYGESTVSVFVRVAVVSCDQSLSLESVQNCLSVYSLTLTSFPVYFETAGSSE